MILLETTQIEQTFVSKIYWTGGALTVHTQLTLPSGVQRIGRQPDFINYQKLTYMVGQFSPGLVFDPTNFKLYQLGIPPPGTAPTIAAASAIATGVTAADVVGYVTFAIKAPDGKILMESNPSPESNEIDLSGQAVTWTVLPTVCFNPDVNVVRLWRSVAGSLPRLAAERPLGTTTATEEVPTLALGSPLPNTDGVLNNAHGVPPYSRFIESYHERGWYAGDPNFPDRIYFSEVGKPWAVGPLSFLQTRDGENVTGLKKLRDQLVVFTKRATYVIQGWTSTDFVQTKVSPNIGCISHHSIVNIDNRLWFASEEGIYIYDGSGFYYQMEELRDHWRDEYINSTFTEAYEQSVGADDRYWRVYKLLIPKPPASDTLLGFYYVGHYGLGPQVEWSFDQRTRRDRSQLGVGTIYFFTGSEDGFVRRDNQTTDLDDDGDTDARSILIRSSVVLFDKPGGDDEEGGKTFHKIYTYVESEHTTWQARIQAGDEEVYAAFTPDNTLYFWKDDVDASLLEVDDINGFDYTYVAKSVHVHNPELVSGRGLMIEIAATSPDRLKYRGFGGYFGPGPAGRPPKSRVVHDPG